MTDTEKYLPESRKLYRQFIHSHIEEYFDDMKECRVGPGSGYWDFYRADEVVQHMRDIFHNLRETFGNVTIPEEFPSPKRLVQTWKWFYEFLLSKEELFEDIKKISKKKKTQPSAPFQIVYRNHTDVKALLEEILSLREVREYLDEANRRDEDNNTPLERFDIVVITALHDTEFEALKNLPVPFTPYPVMDDSTNYLEGTIGSKRILLATDDRMGLAASAGLSTKVIAKFSPHYLIMAGIAAGVKDSEKNYGDILVSRFTWNYESGKYKFDKKAKKTVFEPNPEQIELHEDLVHVINELKSDKSLLKSIKDSFKKSKGNKKSQARLKVWLGPFASGSAVLADEEKVKDIRKNNRKLIGIDMETYGVFYAAKSFSSAYRTKALSIKSVSDFADQKKSDEYRNYAAHTSARFIYELILRKLQ